MLINKAEQDRELERLGYDPDTTDYITLRGWLIEALQEIEILESYLRRFEGKEEQNGSQ